MCVVEGCERRSQLGQLVCKDHEGTELGFATSRQVVKLEREIRSLAEADSEEERRLAANRFQRRVERGDFAAIFSGKFQELLERGSERGLEHVAGALQVAIVRLLMEERDPAKMATALAKVAHALSSVKRTEEKLEREQDVFSEKFEMAWKLYGPPKRYRLKQDADGEEYLEKIEQGKGGGAAGESDQPIEAKWTEMGKEMDAAYQRYEERIRESPPSTPEAIREGIAASAVTPYFPSDDGWVDAWEGEEGAEAGSAVEEEGGHSDEQRRREAQWREEYARRKLWAGALEEGAPRRG